jgi:glutamyl aminopeptidase
MNELVIPTTGSIDWIKFNKDQVGYYRVKYNVSMWQSLNNALEGNINTMSVLDRAHLLNDVFSLAEGLQVPYDTALTMTKYLKAETSFVPWDVASSKLKGIRNLLYYTEFYPMFKEYVVNLVDDAYVKIGEWNVDPDAHLAK